MVILHRHRIDALRIQRRDHRSLGYVAEQSNLRPFAFGQRLFAAAHQHVWLHAERRQFAHRMLRRLGLQLTRRRDIRHQRHVDADRIAASEIVAELPDRLDERQRFDIADRPADFAQHEIEIVGLGLREFLDRIGDVRDDLHRGAQIIAAPLARDDLLIDSARGDIVRLARRDAGEAFVMAQVEIGLGPVIRHIDFAMLIGRHRPRIDVKIRIELANPDAIAARLQEGGERCRHQTLAKRGDHAAGNENEPRHGRKDLA
ncbi:hypothetical protein D9M73_107980 [compost metagenome]